MIVAASQSFGEILKKAGLNTLLGMGVVFTVLILISILIYCLRYIPGILEYLDRTVLDAIRGAFGKKKKFVPAVETETVKAGVAAVDEAAAIASEASEAQTPECSLLSDLELVAVITAAIAAASDTPADGIIIRSIRRSPKNNWKHA